MTYCVHIYYYDTIYGNKCKQHFKHTTIAHMKSSKKTSKVSSKIKKAYQAPKWLNKIPLGAHGSTPIQKKYWKVVSDTVRLRDWKLGCISCGRKPESWQGLQAGHYKSWASCRGYSKWDMNNLFGQCGFCNTGFNSNEVGANFKEGILKRHGLERLVYIQQLNAYPTEKMEDHVIVERIKVLIEAMGDMEARPDYYYLVISSHDWNTSRIL
jgi:hypothetical protein